MRDVTKLRRRSFLVRFWSPSVLINMSSGQQWVLVEMVQAFYEVSSRGSGLGGAEFAGWVRVIRI